MVGTAWGRRCQATAGRGHMVAVEGVHPMWRVASGKGTGGWVDGSMARRGVRGMEAMEEGMPARAESRALVEQAVEVEVVLQEGHGKV